jgi:hypothetical protein
MRDLAFEFVNVRLTSQPTQAWTIQKNALAGLVQPRVRACTSLRRGHALHRLTGLRFVDQKHIPLVLVLGAVTICWLGGNKGE